MEDTAGLQHKHIIVRAHVAEPPQDVKYIETWCQELIEAIGMKIARGPIAYYSDMEGNRGLTCVTIIETSHLALHVWDEVSPALLEFDLYTCSTLDIPIVLEYLEEFKPMQVEWMFLDRKYDLTIQERGRVSREPAT